MASSLCQEIQTFCSNSKHLRLIITDTRKCFRDINNVGTFNGTQIATADLSATEDEQLENSCMLKKPPCYVVFGQNAYCKAYVVNEIFSRPILPLPQPADKNVKWRAVRFKYGATQHVSLCLPNSFELVDNLESHKSQWSTVPPQDLYVSEEGRKGSNTHEEPDPTGEFPSTIMDTANDSAILEVCLDHLLLKEGAHLSMSSSEGVGDRTSLDSLRICTEDVNPIFIYALSEQTLSAQECSDLAEIKETMEDIAVFFVKVPTVTSTTPAQVEKPSTHKQSPMSALRNTLLKNNITESLFSQNNRSDLFRPISLHSSRAAMESSTAAFNLFQQLLDLGYVSFLPGSSPADFARCRHDSTSHTRTSYVDSEFVENFDNFPNLIQFTHAVLQNYLIKTVCLLNVIHTRCLQMFINTAFDMARDMIITPRKLEFAKEKETLLYKSLMEMAIKNQDEIRKIIADTISGMRDELIEKAEDYEFIGVDIPETGELTSSKDLKICTGQIQELVIGNLNSAIASRLLESVDILKDSYTGVLERCLESLEQSDIENKDAVQTSMALREILNAAYQVEITVRAGSSLVKVLLEKMKQLMQSMPWRTPPLINNEWKRNVAADMLDSLSDSRYRNLDRLAKSICAQIKDRLKQSHDTFATALKQLEQRHSGRLERTEEQRLKVRKVHAPKVARLVLESTSYKDFLIHGMCVMGREVGRGQYGVVYSCESWGGFSPCAIKSVVPPDDKHWNDLALEYYYTKNVPEHDRIVALRGSVIDYTYGGGGSAAVLLIMDRLQRDLYAAIKAGLTWLPRLQVAIDVVEGIRFLHSQGLVHRDIKLKNVLLDRENRGKITDLGFCKPEAMMSGSIVGTPIHMAPELFSGRYDNSVDVYAFGVLFWYVCAGHVKLPRAFEQCANKEMLWTSVRRGVRPEFLPQFDDECWQLMQSCWEGEPAQRPLLGIVEPQLVSIYDNYEKLEKTGVKSPAHTAKPVPSKARSSPKPTYT